jgi:transmembrane sensor
MNKKDFSEYKMEDFLTDESFVNYCFCRNAADELFWKEWFLIHPEKKSLEEEAKEILQMLSLTLSENEYRTELARIKTSTASEVIQLNAPTIAHSLSWKKLASMAAVIVFCIGGYLIFQHEQTNSLGLTETFNNKNVPLIFTLSDKTVVTLAAHSSIRYPAKFGNKERKVYLNGEAGFSVTHSAFHPFKVYEDDLIATDLGTVFNIKKPNADSVVVIELLEGKLQVETATSSGAPLQSIILSPNEKVVYNKNEKLLSKGLLFVSTRRVEDIIFKNDGFNTIANNFTDLFGITVINESTKTNWHFTGEFQNITATELIENICIAEDLHYKFQNDTIVIK